MVIVWCLREVRLIWAMGVENRDDPHVVAGLQVALDDLVQSDRRMSEPPY